jgi:hypothetical protein
MGGTIGISNFKILSMRYIKLAQKTTEAKSFLACKGEAAGVVQIFATGNGAWQTEKN